MQTLDISCVLSQVILLSLTWRNLIKNINSHIKIICLLWNKYVLVFVAGPDRHRRHSFRGTQRGSSVGPDATHRRRRWVQPFLFIITVARMESALKPMINGYSSSKVARGSSKRVVSKPYNKYACSTRLPWAGHRTPNE